MAAALDTVRTVAELRARVKEWRDGGAAVGLVPTMGALHEGHLSLARHAQTIADKTVATIFVNPKQFGENEDFGVYPRTEERDGELLASVGTDLLFAPAVGEMYPEGSATQVSVPGIGDVLEGEHRPGFFSGVATIVVKLLLQALPDVAVFGEKDYQQLQVIKRFARDLDIPVRIEGAPTVREADGLAMSSRNAYLNEEERAIAPALNRAIIAVADAARAGGDIRAAESKAMAEVLDAGFKSVDYLCVRDAESLEPVDDVRRPARVLAAAWLGGARLIDNVGVRP